MPKRVLYLSYFYPPLGGPAVLRNLKTVKYLSRAGFEIDVITVADLEYLYRDETLTSQQSERRLFRTRSADPMALLKKLRPASSDEASRIYMNTPEKAKLMIRRLWPIDNKIGWLPFLLQTGRKALRENEYDLIYISLGPFSSGLGAYWLSKESGLPLVLDMRDYWTLLGDYELQGFGWQRRLSRHWEARLYRHASLIVTATQGIGEDICEAFGAGLQSKCLTVYNGWDEEDFEGLDAIHPGQGFELAYFGNIYARRSLGKFYAAVSSLRGEGILPTNTRIKLYGNFFRETVEEAQSSGVSDLVEFVPQLGHREAIRAMLSSHVLLLTLNSSGPRGTLSSKIFEYLRAGRPILAMVPAHKEAASLLRDCGQNYICAMESESSIRQALMRLIAEYEAEKRYPAPPELERAAQISKLAAALESIKN